MNPYDTHVEQCPRCRDNKFDLCATGTKLLADQFEVRRPVTVRKGDIVLAVALLVGVIAAVGYVLGRWLL